LLSFYFYFFQSAAPDIDERQRIDRPQVLVTGSGGLSIKIGRVVKAALCIAGCAAIQKRRHISRLRRLNRHKSAAYF